MQYDRGNLDKYRSRNPIKQFLIKKLDRKILFILNKLVSDKKRVYHILDAGCGEGFLTDLIYKNFKNVEITGLECVQEALDIAKRMNDKICFQQGNIYRMPYEDSAFDIVICSEVLEHLQHPNRALRELERVSGIALLLTVPDEPWFCLGNLLALKNIQSLGNPAGHINHWTYSGFVRYIDSIFSNRYKKLARGVPTWCGGGYLESARSFPWIMVLVQKRL